MNKAYAQKDLWFNLYVDKIGKKPITNDAGIKMVGPYISQYEADIDAQDGRINCIMITKEVLEINAIEGDT